MPAAKELVANDRTEEEVAEILGADRVFYQTLPDLITACSGGRKGITAFDTSCFSNKYVTALDKNYFKDLEILRNDQAKQSA
jgi:amidophosphoribosyltransferase